MAKDVTAQLTNKQMIEVVVNGPDGANRLYLCTGTIDLSGSAGGGAGRENLVFHVGPALGRRQMHSASAMIGLGGFHTLATQFVENTQGTFNFSILNADADWDDEMGQVQARVETEASGHPWLPGISSLTYQVTILAEV